MSKMRFLRLATHGRLIGFGSPGWKEGDVVLTSYNGMRSEEGEGIKATISGQCMRENDDDTSTFRHLSRRLN